MMNYNFFTKCVFISSKHAIFDVYIRKNGKDVVVEGNIIIDSSMNANHEFLVPEYYTPLFNSMFDEIIKRCRERAQFVFNKN